MNKKPANIALTFIMKNKKRSAEEIIRAEVLFVETLSSFYEKILLSIIGYGEQFH